MMKYPLVLLLLLFSLAAHSQQKIVTIQGGQLFLKPNQWKFKAGDSLAWANPTYNDSHWKKEDASLVENKALWEAKKGWFRTTYRFRKKRLNRKYYLTINHFGRSELYLDGRLFARITPSDPDNPASQLAFVQIPFSIVDTNEHVLALRYSFRQDPLYYAATSQAPFDMSFDPVNESLLNQLTSTAWNTAVGSMLAGIFGILSLLHFLFYRANPAQRINAILTATTFCFTIVFALSTFDGFTTTLTQKSLLDLGQSLGVHLGFGLLLMAVYTYLRRPYGWFFYGSIALLPITFLYHCFVGSFRDGQFIIPFLLVIADYIRVSWLGKKYGDKNDKLPWNSLKFSFFAFLALVFIAIGNGILVSLMGVEEATVLFVFIVILFLFLVLLSIPIGLSLSLVRDYARTYESLRQNLEAVQQLSARTLAQEQEKQHILATQNETLERQVNERTAELHQSLETLKTTQTQLIQKEKMASLGELTAGIAHEIQNPLNFVTNFSEVSVELLTEIQEERERPTDQRDDELENEILTDLQQNLQKITHHGKRASSIVRGMLEHSRTSSGDKHPTNLNALADEYLRLAYHGQRAAHKTFNCQLITDFSPEVPTLNLIPQDMGRVLLNLFNNAFYAVQQRQKTVPDNYQPTVWVSTALIDPNTVELRIRDNGTGIPSDLVSKIFQPFFTTKPTGEGTGLGLSLSYDIVTKSHQGSLSVSSTEGEGTEFVSRLPIN